MNFRNSPRMRTFKTNTICIYLFAILQNTKIIRQDQVEVVGSMLAHIK